MNEFFASSDMYGFELLKKVDRKIRSSSSARFVPRCGVERKVIAEIALMIDSYSGSFWPCMYACTMSVKDIKKEGIFTSLIMSPPIL